MKLTFRVEGLDKLCAQLLAIRDTAKGNKAMQRAARKAFKPVITRAKELVPVRTGALRDAIKLSVIKPKSGPFALSVGLKVGKAKIKDELAEADEFAPAVVSTHTVDMGPFWHLIELGTSRGKAHPYIRPSFDELAFDLPARFGAALQPEIDKAVRAGKAES